MANFFCVQNIIFCLPKDYNFVTSFVENYPNLFFYNFSPEILHVNAGINNFQAYLYDANLTEIENINIEMFMEREPFEKTKLDIQMILDTKKNILDKLEQCLDICRTRLVPYKYMIVPHQAHQEILQFITDKQHVESFSKNEYITWYEQSKPFNYTDLDDKEEFVYGKKTFLLTVIIYKYHGYTFVTLDNIRNKNYLFGYKSKITIRGKYDYHKEILIVNEKEVDIDKNIQIQADNNLIKIDTINKNIYITN